MPGLIALGRRWSLGSDDLVLPGCVLFAVHTAWLVALSIILALYQSQREACSSSLWNYIIGYMVILTVCLFIEGAIVLVSMKGTIFYTRPRSSMEYLLYGRSVLLLICLLWAFLGIVWLAQGFQQCPMWAIKNSVLGIVVYNLLLFVLIMARTWCLYDSAGRSFVQLKQTEKRFAMRRSASRLERNRVQQLKTRELYERNWEKRFHRYCCCVQVNEPQENAFTEIALLFSDFFRDLDVVPSDIVAGLMLLREEQKQRRRSTERNPNNNVLKFLSGVAITRDTKFADFSNHDECQEFEELIYYYKYAAAAYGWPVYAMFHPVKGCCHLIGRCSCCRPANSFEFLDLDDDNCCSCNFTALKKLSGLEDADVVYATFHSAVSTSLRDPPHNLSAEFGLDMEGLNLVGDTAATAGAGVSTTNTTAASKGGLTAGATGTAESGICLETSLSFQEEMDERCLRGAGGGADKRGRSGRDAARSPFPSCMACLCPSRSQNCPPSRHSSATSSAENLDTPATVWETPFFVALDHSRRRVIVSVRGTLSMQDWLTDLSADTSTIPLENCPSDWFGHKGMVGAAVHIKKKLQDEMILSRAFSHDPERGTQNYELVLVGHSLGAGTVSILSILLRPDYPKLQCYAYSPPGGLLSMPVVEYTKDFVTSLVIGKDIVTRVGLSQMEYLRADLLDCIKRSTDTKWRIIFDGLLCCREIDPKNLTPRDTDSSPSPPRMTKAFHPTNLSLLLTTHNPLYPPGRIVQVVRTNPNREGLDKKDCAWYAVWRDNTAFDEVLISPVMIGDHLPKNVMTALHKCLQYGRLHGPPKFSYRQGSRSPSPHRSWAKQQRGKNGSPTSTPSSCLVMDMGNHGDAGPDRNCNTVQQSDGQAKRNAFELQNVPKRPAGASHSGKGNMQRTGSMSPVYASYDSLPKIPGVDVNPDGRAPLARFDTMSEIGSLSSFHSATLEEPRPHQSHRMYDGYCYYVNEDLTSPLTSFQLHSRLDDSVTSDGNNQIVTTALVESKPDRTSVSLSDSVKLHRDGSTKVLDRYGNIKGRTSTNDRYRLTYDNGSQSSLNKDYLARPEQLIFTNASGSSYTSSGNVSSDRSPSTPDALLGQAYTCYHSLSLDGSSPDFEEDFPYPFPSSNPDSTFQHAPVPKETSGLLQEEKQDSSGNGNKAATVTDDIPGSRQTKASQTKLGERVRSLRQKYGETKC